MIAAYNGYGWKNAFLFKLTYSYTPNLKMLSHLKTEIHIVQRKTHPQVFAA